jgi:hypothetical protein
MTNIITRVSTLQLILGALTVVGKDKPLSFLQKWYQPTYTEDMQTVTRRTDVSIDPVADQDDLRIIDILTRLTSFNYMSYKRLAANTVENFIKKFEIDVLAHHFDVNWRTNLTEHDIHQMATDIFILLRKQDASLTVDENDIPETLIPIFSKSMAEYHESSERATSEIMAAVSASATVGTLDAALNLLTKQQPLDNQPSAANEPQQLDGTTMPTTKAVENKKQKQQPEIETTTVSLLDIACGISRTLSNVSPIDLLTRLSKPHTPPLVAVLEHMPASLAGLTQETVSLENVNELLADAEVSVSLLNLLVDLTMALDSMRVSSTTDWDADRELNKVHKVVVDSTGELSTIVDGRVAMIAESFETLDAIINIDPTGLGYSAYVLKQMWLSYDENIEKTLIAVLQSANLKLLTAAA